MKTGNNETSDGICPHCGGRGFIQTVFIRTENTMKPEENSGVTKLSNYPEGNTGVVMDLLNVVHDEVKQLKAENAELRKSLSELQLAFNIMEDPGSRLTKMKTSLSELIKICEAHKGDMTSEKMIIIYESESAIERAKKHL